MANVGYRVEFAKGVARQMRDIPRKHLERIAARIDALARDPRPRGAEKVEGQEGVLRVRVGDYRILYEIQDLRLLILVLRVGHRRDVYRDL